jgi:hypothetical protein
MASSARWLPLTGIAYAALIVAGFLTVGEPPLSSESADNISSFYVDRLPRLRVAWVMSSLGLVAGMFFASTLRRRLGDQSAILSQVTFGGWVLYTAGAATDVSLLMALAQSANDVDPAQMQTLQALYENNWGLILVGIATFHLACGLGILSRRVLPAWLGALALVVAVLAVTPFGYLAVPATGFWVVIASVVLLIHEHGASEQPRS